MSPLPHNHTHIPASSRRSRSYPLRKISAAFVVLVVIIIFSSLTVGGGPFSSETFGGLNRLWSSSPSKWADQDSFSVASETPSFASPSTSEDENTLLNEDLPSKSAESYSSSLTSTKPQVRVRVDLNVMSRCPDARVCEAMMDEVLLSSGIRDRITLKMNYIGTIDRDQTYGVKCLHGDKECAGNIHQLCVQELGPVSSSNTSALASFASSKMKSKIRTPSRPPPREIESALVPPSPLPPVWSFIQAQNYFDPRKIGSLEYAQMCADAVGLEWEKSGVAKCVNGAGGEGEGIVVEEETEEEEEEEEDEEDESWEGTGNHRNKNRSTGPTIDARTKKESLGVRLLRESAKKVMRLDAR